MILRVSPSPCGLPIMHSHMTSSAPPCCEWKNVTLLTMGGTKWLYIYSHPHFSFDPPSMLNNINSLAQDWGNSAVTAVLR